MSYLVDRRLPAATDQQMDALFEDELASLIPQALIKLNIDESETVAEPIAIWGPSKEFEGASIPLSLKKGKDNLVRFNPIDLCIIFFTEHQLSSFQCCYDRFTGNCLGIRTDEYFYRDVVSVSTISEDESKEVIIDITPRYKFSLFRKTSTKRIQIRKSEVFKLTTSGATCINVSLGSETLLEESGCEGGHLPMQQAERAIAIIRRLLRDKKSK